VATRSLVGMPPPTYVMPTEIVKPVEHLLDAWRALDGSTLPCTLVGTRPGDEWSPRPDLLVRTFRSHHPVVTQGYVLNRRKKTLHPDLRGLSQSEIRQKRLAGEPVDFFVETPEVAFTGDSRIEVLDHEPDLYRARLLLMEVTFLDDRISPEKARSRGHIHLDDVLERAEHFENEAILFTHLSARYSPTEALEILEKRLPAGLRDRVTLLLPPPEYKTRL
jgi:ribonuclease Z